MSPDRRALLQIHLCVLLWAFTAILGRLIDLAATQIVIWRLILVVLVLVSMPKAWRGLLSLPRALWWHYAGIGCVVALHWLAFYGAVKFANASAATICLAVAPLVVALFEPLIHRKPVRRTDLALGVAVLPGAALIVGGTPASMNAGLGLGLVAAVLGATFMSLNKRHAGEHDALGVTAVEMSAGLVLMLALSPLLAGEGAAIVVPATNDLLLLLLLASVCTVVPFALSLVALRKLSAFTVQLAVNLEPVYAMVVAAILLGEAQELGTGFYAGAAIVIAAVLAQAALGRRRSRRVMPD